MHIFTYGSLMFDPVWTRVVRGRYRSLGASLGGYLRRRVNGESYPALLPSREADRVDGLLYFDISPQDLRRLDRFEGDPYRRRLVSVMTSKGAVICEVYVFRAQYARRVSDKPWEPQWFASTGIHALCNRHRFF